MMTERLVTLASKSEVDCFWAERGHCRRSIRTLRSAIVCRSGPSREPRRRPLRQPVVLMPVPSTSPSVAAWFSLRMQNTSRQTLDNPVEIERSKIGFGNLLLSVHYISGRNITSRVTRF